jgi:GT2 family glycosyltransferase
MKDQLKEKIAISIVTYEALDYVKLSIDTLEWAIDKDEVQISIIDNSNSEEISEYIKGLKGYNILYHHSPDNLGFGKGHNLSYKKYIKDWGPDFLVLANPDLKLEEESLYALIDEFKKLEKDERVGLVGPRLINENGNVENSILDDTNVLDLGFNMFTQLIGKKRKERMLPNKVTEVFGLSGALLLFRPSLIDEVGLFDNDFFMYHEDTDFSARLNSSGRKNYYIPQVTFTHSIGKSKGDSLEAQNWRKERMMKSYLTYFIKNKGFLQTRILKLIWIIGLILRILLGKDRKWAKKQLPEIIKFDYIS